MSATDSPIPDIDESGKAISPEMIDALGRLAARDEEIARLNKIVADLTEMVISCRWLAFPLQYTQGLVREWRSRHVTARRQARLLTHTRRHAIDHPQKIRKNRQGQRH